eukprot:2201962-Amphidinium_carterae.1
MLQNMLDDQKHDSILTNVFGSKLGHDALELLEQCNFSIIVSKNKTIVTKTIRSYERTTNLTYFQDKANLGNANP